MKKKVHYGQLITYINNKANKGFKKGTVLKIGGRW